MGLTHLAMLGCTAMLLLSASFSLQIEHGQQRATKKSSSSLALEDKPCITEVCSFLVSTGELNQAPQCVQFLNAFTQSGKSEKLSKKSAKVEKLHAKLEKIAKKLSSTEVKRLIGRNKKVVDMDRLRVYQPIVEYFKENTEKAFATCMEVLQWRDNHTDDMLRAADSKRKPVGQTDPQDEPVKKPRGRRSGSLEQEVTVHGDEGDDSGDRKTKERDDGDDSGEGAKEGGDVRHDVIGVPTKPNGDQVHLATDNVVDVDPFKDVGGNPTVTERPTAERDNVDEVVEPSKNDDDSGNSLEKRDDVVDDSSEKRDDVVDDVGITHDTHQATVTASDDVTQSIQRLPKDGSKCFHPPATDVPQFCSGIVDYPVYMEEDPGLPDGWAQAEHQGATYYWKDAVSVWEHPGYAAVMKRRHEEAESLVKSIANSDKPGCDSHVKNAVCHTLFPRCEGDGVQLDGSTVQGVKSLTSGTCSSMCHAVKDLQCVKDSAPSEWKTKLSNCNASPWSDTDCCCSHTWGLFASGGILQSDKHFAASFWADTGIQSSMQENARYRQVWLANVDRFDQELLQNQFYLGDDNVHSSAVLHRPDYVRSMTNVDTMRKALQLEPKSSETLKAECANVKQGVKECENFARAKKIGYGIPRGFASGWALQIMKMKGLPEYMAGGKVLNEAIKESENQVCYNYLKENQKFRFSMYKEQHMNEELGFLQGLKLVPDQPCSGQTIDSSPEDYLVLSVSTHGSNRHLCLNGQCAGAEQQLSDTQLKDMVLELYEQRRFKQLLILFDACHTGSMFLHWQDSMPPGVFGIAAAMGEFVGWGTRSSLMPHSDDDIQSIRGSHFTNAFKTLYDSSAAKGSASLEGMCHALENDLSTLDTDTVNVEYAPSLLPRCFGVNDPANIPDSGYNANARHFFSSVGVVSSAADPNDRAAADYLRAVKEHGDDREKDRQEKIQAVYGKRDQAKKEKMKQFRESMLEAKDLMVSSSSNSDGDMYPKPPNRKEEVKDDSLRTPLFWKWTFDELKKLDCSTELIPVLEATPPENIQLGEESDLKYAIARYGAFVMMGKHQVDSLEHFNSAAIEKVKEQGFGPKSGTTVTLPSTITDPKTLWLTFQKYTEEMQFTMTNKKFDVSIGPASSIFLLEALMAQVEDLVAHCEESKPLMHTMVREAYEWSTVGWKKVEDKLGAWRR